MSLGFSKKYPKYKHGDKIDHGTHTGPDSLTKQEFAHESDINTIMKRYKTSGDLPNRVDSLQPIFADVSGIGDYADVLRRVDAAREAFSGLDARVRSRFANDPLELVEFLQNEGNRAEAVELGLIPKPVEPPAPVVPAVPAPVKP